MDRDTGSSIWNWTRKGAGVSPRSRRPISINRWPFLVDDQVLSVPTIRSKITDKLQITGNFSKEEVKGLVAALMDGHDAARADERARAERRRTLAIVKGICAAARRRGREQWHMSSYSPGTVSVS